MNFGEIYLFCWTDQSFISFENLASPVIAKKCILFIKSVIRIVLNGRVNV